MKKTKAAKKVAEIVDKNKLYVNYSDMEDDLMKLLNYM